MIHNRERPLLLISLQSCSPNKPEFTTRKFKDIVRVYHVLFLPPLYCVYPHLSYLYLLRTVFTLIFPIFIFSELCLLQSALFLSPLDCVYPYASYFSPICTVFTPIRPIFTSSVHSYSSSVLFVFFVVSPGCAFYSNRHL